MQAAAARAAVASGRGSAADALAADAALVELASRTRELQSGARQAELELARWIGEEASRPLAPLPSFDELTIAEATLAEALHQHADILTFEPRLAAARAEVDLARAERRPDWSAELNFAKRGPDFSDMASLQFRIDLPLFARQRQNPVIAARRAELRRVEAERESELRMHRAEVRQTLAAWNSLGEIGRAHV